MSNIIFSGW